jgi:hypothetical protein
MLGRLPRLPQRLRSPRFLGLAALACAVGAGVILALALTGSSSSPASAGASTRTAPLESIFEADVQLDADPGGTLDLFRRLGVDRVRVFVPWGLIYGRPPITPDPLSTVKPRFDASDPAAYPRAGWAMYDAIVRAAAARGIGLDFTLGPPAPAWALGRGVPPGAPPGSWKPSAPLFGQFVRAIGTRYSGHYPDPLHPGHTLPRVSFWAIWNEPNFGIDLAPQAVEHTKLEVSPRLYRGLLDAAWSALRASGHGRDTILIGELSPKGQTFGNHPGNFDGMVPLRFLRALYCVDGDFHVLRGAAAAARGCPGSAAAFPREHPALFQATAFSDHPYPQTLPPDEPTPNEPDFADFPALPKLEHTLDRLQEVYGSSKRFDIYSTEYGYLTTPPEKLFHADSPATAAVYLNWAEYLSWRDSRIRSYDQYLLTDSPTGTFPNGLRFADGRPKATFFAYRLPIFMPVTAARAGQRLEVWGCARPVRYAQGSASVAIQFQAPAGGAFRTLRTVPLHGSSCYFDVRQAFPSSGTVRLAWRYPGGAWIYSRDVRLTLR